MYFSPANTSSSSLASTSTFQTMNSAMANSSKVFFPQMIGVASSSEILGSVATTPAIIEATPTTSENLLRALNTTSAQFEEKEPLPKSAQESQFASILQTAFSSDLWLASSFRVRNLTPQQSTEAYNHSKLLISSLKAKTAWIRIKIEVATLLPLNAANPNDTKAIEHIWRKIKKNLSKLIKYALEHQTCLQKRQDDKMPEKPKEADINILKIKDKKWALARSNARKSLRSADNAYKTILKRRFLDDATILDRMPKYLRNKNAISMIINKFPELKMETINQIIDTASKSETNQSILEPDLHIEQASFKATRLITPEIFWQNLMEKELTEIEFRQEFFKFLFTSWESNADIKLAIMNEIDEAKRSNDLALECQLRNNWQFRENLYKRAYGILHNILIFIRNKAKFDATHKNNLRSRNIFAKQLELSTEKINLHCNDVYLKDYKSYLYNKSKNWEEADLEEQIEKLDNDSREYQLILKKNKKQDNQDMAKNIPIINSVLAELKTNSFITGKKFESIINNKAQKITSSFQSSTAIHPLFELSTQNAFTPHQFLTSKDLDISESLPDDLFSNEPSYIQFTTP